MITFLVLVKFGFNLSNLLGTAAEKSGKGEAFLQPGLLSQIQTSAGNLASPLLAQAVGDGEGTSVDRSSWL